MNKPINLGNIEINSSSDNDNKTILYFASGGSLFIFIIWTILFILPTTYNMVVGMIKITIFSIVGYVFLVTFDILFFTGFYKLYPETVEILDDSILITALLMLKRKRIPYNSIKRADMLIRENGGIALELILTGNKKIILRPIHHSQAFIDYLFTRLQKNNIAGTKISVKNIGTE